VRWARLDRLIGGDGNRRTLGFLFLAFLFPTLIFAALQIAANYRVERRHIEELALLQAQVIMDAADTAIEGARINLLTYASGPLLREHRWQEAEARAREYLAINRGWRAISVFDRQTGKVVFDTDNQGTASDRRAALVGDPAVPRFGAVKRIGAVGVIPAMAPVAWDTRFQVVVDLSTDPFYRALMKRAPREGVSALVDRAGNFVARSRDHRVRVGTPATSYVRHAIQVGGSGIYQGVTWEGLPSYSAFVTSRATGLSTHIAVPSVRLDRPNDLSTAATLGAALASIGLAVVLGLLVLRTINARHQAERRTAQAQRLETVGKMTGGIAHDFNNMLAIVIGNLDIAERRLAAGRADVAQSLYNARDGAGRAAELTNRLLAFSRRQPHSPDVIDVNATIAALQPLIARTVTDAVDLQLILGADAGAVRVDRSAFENGLINLAANARDAMPDGGRLTIQTGRAGEGGGGEGLTLIGVSDTGVGMSAEVAERALEPFFTTKDIGRGTGLGLSQLHGFVEQSGGSMRLRSSPGEGTRIDILLPRIGDGAERQAAPDPISIQNGARDDMILLVEDEEALRAATEQAITDLGYSVTGVSSADAALAKLRGGDPVSLLFTDVMLPGMSGRDLAREVRKLRPSLPILLTTGFERDDAPGDTDLPVLRKPYKFEELAAALRATMSNGSDA
jgi:signal transduction histidine kinase/CheY-like chemotaxis protein